MYALKNGSFDYRHWVFAGLLFSMFAANYSYAEDDFAARERALNMIADFADRMCKEIPLEGNKENLGLSGNAKAELRGLIKNLVDLGVEGAVIYTNSEYEGVLQEDLVNALETSTDCKLKIFYKLEGKFLK